jgi:hypothetical protein
MALLETGDGGPVGRPVFDRQGLKLGKLERVYDDGDRAIWGAVKLRFLRRSHIVPLRDARIGAEKIYLAAGKRQVEGAPPAHEGAALSPELEDRLLRSGGRRPGPLGRSHSRRPPPHHGGAAYSRRDEWRAAVVARPVGGFSP